MAYIGASFPETNYGAKPKDDFLGNGVQTTFVLSQDVAGGSESNVDVYVDNVKQEPIYSYQIVRVIQIQVDNLFGDYSVNGTVTQTTGSEGIVVKHDVGSNIVFIKQTSETAFTTGTALVQANSDGSFTSGIPQIITNEYYKGLEFSEAPKPNQIIYAKHDGGGTFQLVPANGSVTPDKLSDNIRDFTTLTYAATTGQTDFALDRQELSARSLLVTVDGIVQTPVDQYTLSSNGTEITLATPMGGGEKIEIRHLSFSTVSRSVVTETGFMPVSLKIGELDNHIYALQSGNYQITGKMTTVSINIRLVQKGTDIGYLYIDNLPIASYSSSEQYFPLIISNSASWTGTPVVRLVPDSTVLELGQLNNVSGSYEQLDHNLLTNSSFFSTTFSYMNAK